MLVGACVYMQVCLVVCVCGVHESLREIEREREKEM